MEVGKIFIILGIFIVFTGIMTIGKTGFLGRLPGDMIVEGENFSFYFPIATMILISVVASFLFWILRK